MPSRGDMCDDVRASWQWQGFLAVVRFFFLKFVGDTAVFQYFSIISTLLHLTRPVETWRIVRIWREESNPRLLQKDVLATTYRLDGT